MSGFCINRILIDRVVVNSELATRVRRNAADIPVEILPESEAGPFVNSLTHGKRILHITSQSGGLVKPCPATNPPYLCCRYTTIHAMTQCPFDCSYCVLQGYLDNPVITLFANETEIFQEIENLQKLSPNRFFRFGTGELADSLALDDLTHLSGDYLSFFQGRRNALIELKTKSVRIDNLLKRQHTPSHAVISWSVNPDEIIRQEEFRAATLQSRLQAARQCQEAGYLIGFHFDPILYIPGWKDHYQDTVRQIFKTVDPQRVAWISLGSLRFPAEFKGVIQERFPQSKILNEEMIRGLDGKMRYPRPLRVALYRQVYLAIRQAATDAAPFVYFCMESPAVWDAVMGRHPESNAELDFWFAQDLWMRFGSELNMDEPQLKFYPDEESKPRRL